MKNKIKFVYSITLLLFCTYLFAQQIRPMGLGLLESKSFVVTSDVDLHGDTLRFQKGCRIIFKGGKFNNGVIIGNNTSISVKQNFPAFGLNLTIEGRWNVKKVYDKWFEFDSRPTFVSNRIVHNILALSNNDTFCHIFFDEPRTYYFQLEYDGRPYIWNILSYDKCRKAWKLSCLGCSSSHKLIFLSHSSLYP